ncbi:MAG: hypothetical protein IKU79_02185 [Bacteroidaceae bacterium]|nr:hypothetical protein [Bacteroidaceae bacterium]
MMKKILTIIMLVGALLNLSAEAPIGIIGHKEGEQITDTISKMNFMEGRKVVSGKMSFSASPVGLYVVGKSVRVESPEKQILPIYTQNGMFYLIFRLNKGTNWLNGLPKGGYYINGKLITIK